MVVHTWTWEDSHFRNFCSKNKNILRAILHKEPNELWVLSRTFFISTVPTRISDSFNSASVNYRRKLGRWDGSNLTSYPYAFQKSLKLHVFFSFIVAEKIHILRPFVAQQFDTVISRYPNLFTTLPSYESEDRCPSKRFNFHFAPLSKAP